MDGLVGGVVGVLGGAKKSESRGSEPVAALLLLPSAADQALDASLKRLALNWRRICSALMPPLLPVAARMLRTSSCARMDKGEKKQRRGTHGRWSQERSTQGEV